MKTQVVSSARERILDKAAELFDREGVRAVGVDTIVAECGVAKMTLYRHFASKDELVAAYLERAEEAWWRRFGAALTPSTKDPQAGLLAFFRSLEAEVRAPDFCGCPFTRVRVEFADPAHPGSRLAAEHKRRVHARLRDLAQQAGAVHPAHLADALMLIVQGAYAASALFGPQGPAERIGETAALVIDAHIAPG